jgi:GntR family transcriptional regulator, transcriptional repressor for pyruvate dehydrogenase complex
MSIERASVVPPRLPRMAELVASSLRRRIIGGELGDGAELPREAELLAEFGVSRPSLREALRILETEGLIRIRRGKVGGGVVQVPTAQSTAYHLGLTLQSRGATLRDIAQARVVLEPACAGLAAGQDARARKALVVRLNALIDENELCVGESYAFTEKALEFHAAVVELCGNTTVALLAGVVEAVWSSQERHWAQRVASGGEYPDSKYQKEVILAHRAVVEAIAQGDVDTATRLMRGHLGKSQPYVGDDDRPVDVLATEPGARAAQWL